ncbi:hypothetical protein [Desertivirga xinjiangensis]|uniref:hypothetical protein n=1 Tax=Desertivirga xinjiangensis TaxID=539206 RepID=UPI00210B90FA|nr:hypothetical protein [Pedobacter xinjiangensis]
MIQTQEVKSQIAGFFKQKEMDNNFLVQHIKQAYSAGKLDHNFIRKIIGNCFKSQDHTAILVGSLLLQLDNDEIRELFKEL